MKNKAKIVMPIQPIVEGRFIPNKIVERLLETSTLDMNSLAAEDFSSQDREQFAQLVGYSVHGFGTLSYVSNETYSAAIQKMESGATEQEARMNHLREILKDVKKSIREASVTLFNIHPDDLGSEE